VKIIFSQHPCHLWGLSHQLGTARRSLGELSGAGLLANPVEYLEKAGYQCNAGLDKDQDLFSLAGAALSNLLKLCPQPSLLIVHHSYAESASYPPAQGRELMNRAQYSAAALARRFEIDHLPYLGSFATGCTGMISLLTMAGSLLSCSDLNEVICLTADCRPPGTNYDMLREKILTSDAASGFIVGAQPKGFRLLGLAYYSSTRAAIPLVEIVKRSVKMVKELAGDLGVQSELADALLHYPNIFKPAWDMVSQYLNAKPGQHIMEGMKERAHCLSSDSILSLDSWQGKRPGRLHVVFNFGSGLHLGICILKEV
jgi:hypothetical protein